MNYTHSFLKYYLRTKRKFGRYKREERVKNNKRAQQFDGLRTRVSMKQNKTSFELM